jgi:hypothetical protein
MVCKEISKIIGKKLAAVITLHAFNGFMELGAHKINKILKDSPSIRFISQGESQSDKGIDNRARQLSTPEAR